MDEEVRRMELVQAIGRLLERFTTTVETEEELSGYANLESSRRELQDSVIKALFEALRELQSLGTAPCANDFEHDNEMIKRIVRDHLEPDKLLCHLGCTSEDSRCIAKLN